MIDIGKRMSRDDIVTLVRQGTGRMPAFPDMGARNINDVVEFLVTDLGDYVNGAIIPIDGGSVP